MVSKKAKVSFTFNPNNATPLPIIAHVSRVVTQAVELIVGDRVDVPLLVASACVEALKYFNCEARVMYGKVAWIEVLEDQSLVWAGCWGENFYFWVATQFGEVVDLNTSVAYRRRAHSHPEYKACYSPPLLWSAEVPLFYRFIPEGVSELELLDERDQAHYAAVLRLIQEKSKIDINALLAIPERDLEFPNEPILCSGRRLLDDSQGTFKFFDRALSVQGLPRAPI